MLISDVDFLGRNALVRCHAIEKPHRSFKRGYVYKVVSVNWFELTDGTKYPMIYAIDPDSDPQNPLKIGFMYYEVDMVKTTNN